MWLRTGTETNSRLVSDIRDLVRVHLGGRRHLRDIRRRTSDCWTGRNLAVGHRGGRADAGGAGGRAVRGPHRPQRVLVSMGVSAGQPEDRLVFRLADLLV